MSASSVSLGERRHRAYKTSKIVVARTGRIVSTIHMSKAIFGSFVPEKREELYAMDSKYSLRQVAGRMGVIPAYLSQVERGEGSLPNEKRIRQLAAELDEDPDMLLAMAGKVSEDLQGIIREHPKTFADLIREMKDMPEHAILRLVREVRDGDW